MPGHKLPVTLYLSQQAYVQVTWSMEYLMLCLNEKGLEQDEIEGSIKLVKKPEVANCCIAIC